MKQNILHISIAVICILLLCTGTVSAKEITVGPELGNSTITAALANAIDGDTIIVKNGTYTENIDVEKEVIIRSESGADYTSVIASNSSGRVFNVTADNVTIHGFNITGASYYCIEDEENEDDEEDGAGILLNGNTNCTVSNNSLSGNGCGIWLKNSNDNNLTDNNAEDNFIGICLDESNRNTLKRNIMSSNTYNLDIGIFIQIENHNDIDTSNLVENKPVYYLSDRSDVVIPSNAGLVYAINSNNITVDGVNIRNETAGIVFYKTGNSTIKNCRVSDCASGIALGESNRNNLTDNNVSDNSIGISLDFSNNNTLKRNIMSSNIYNLDINVGLERETFNDIDTSNLVDNKPVYYLLDRSDVTVPPNAGVVYAINSSNIIVNGVNIQNETVGIVFYKTRNSTIKNSRISDCLAGIYMCNSSNYNTLTGNSANNNVMFGLYIENSTNNALTGNSGDNNEMAGLYIENSNNNTLTGNSANNNKIIGLYLGCSSNNTLTDNTANGNGEGKEEDIGIALTEGSDCNILTGNSANNNKKYGFFVMGANNNTLTRNVANNNAENGISLFQAPDNVLVSNTAMGNAKQDIAVAYAINNEIKNTKLTQDSALVSFLSDDTQIGIKGDATNSTTLAGKVNVNGYLTLVRRGLVELTSGISTTGEIPTLNITIFYDDAGMSNSGEASIDLYKYNQTVNETTWTVVNGTSLNTSLNQVNATIRGGTFALFKDPEPTRSDDGVRVSLGQGQSPEIVKSYATSMMRVIGGSPVEYDFSGSDTPVLGISFDAKQDKGLVVAKVQVLSSAPEGVPAPSGNAYQILSIDVGSEGTISSDSADDVMIHFKVSKKWIEENNIDISTIRMTRYHGEQWNELPTTQENEDDEYFYFYAETPGFSVFEIVGDEIGETPEQVPVASPTTEEDDEPEEDAENSLPGFTALAGIVLVSLAVLVRRK